MPEFGGRHSSRTRLDEWPTSKHDFYRSTSAGPARRHPPVGLGPVEPAGSETPGRRFALAAAGSVTGSEPVPDRLDRTSGLDEGAGCVESPRAV